MSCQQEADLYNRGMPRLICRLAPAFFMLVCLILCSCSIASSRVGGFTPTPVKTKAQKPNHPYTVSTFSATSRPMSDPPVRLQIPVIGVDTEIEPVGVSQSGDLNTPQKNPWDTAGWYSAGPSPGERGSAVIDGHLDRTGGDPAVFWNLKNLQAGDEIRVVHHSGKISLFRVQRAASYPPKGAPLQAIFGAGGGHYLNLITCAGDWIPSEHQTTLRMVVYSELAH